MACLYKRKGRYWIAYYVDGRLIQKSLRTTNERVARDKKRKIEYELAVGDLQTASKLPLPAILEAFCSYLETIATRKSYKNEISRLRVFFGPICPPLRPCVPGDATGRRRRRPFPDKYARAHVKAKLLEDITGELINRFIAARLQRDGWSAKTANSMRQTLHRLFAYAAKHHGFCSRDRRHPNPAAAVERQREAAPEIRFLSLDQIDEQLSVLGPHPVIHALVATYIYAGLRREEALWLTHEDVRVEDRLIRVQAKTIDGEFWQPKTKRNRVVPISDDLLEVLQAYRPPDSPSWFFPSPKDKRWHPDNFSHDLRAINKAAGLPWACLDYRHTFGSHLAQKGESLYKIATLMGNSPDICRRHYAALIPEAMHDVVEFGSSRSGAKQQDGTQELLQQILRKLEGDQADEEAKPELRIVR